MGNIEYKYKETTIESLVEENEESTITTQFSASDVIPNQCWAGYYNKSVFNSTQNKPTSIKFKDFGVSIQNYGCAVCCCVGAYNLLYPENTPLTVYDLWQKNGFLWNPKITNKPGQSCGTTKAVWSRTPDISISTGKIHFDDTRTYPFANPNSYYKEPNLSQEKYEGISASDFYVPSGWSGHNILTDNYKIKQVAAMIDIKEAVDNNNCCILYICNSTRNTGHYVLAYGSTYTSGTYSYDQIQVCDPCPSLTYQGWQQHHVKRSNQYYGANTTLDESMKRINSDLSDGIRTVAICKKKSQ